VRPLLKPALRRLWRDTLTLQIGLDPQRAVVLTGVDPAAARFVDALDGTRDRQAALAHARTLGLESGVATALLDLLAAGGVLDDASADRSPLAQLSPGERDRLAPDIATLSLTSPHPDGGIGTLGGRRAATVRVVGAGRVGAAVAALLAAAGVGSVLVDDPALTRAADLGPAGLHQDAVGARREDAARAAMRRLAPGTRADLPQGRTRPDVVVLASTSSSTDHGVADHQLRAGVPHLLVEVRETTGVVGPFVLPGRSSCLRCVELHRRDRDPAWPRLAAQLAAAGPATTPPCDVALATFVAAQAVLQVLTHLAGDVAPLAVGGALETRLPEGRTRRRSWPPHPACGCRWDGEQPTDRRPAVPYAAGPAPCPPAAS
jgi:bacteriocin biosynthesis cyclodehydratase domain-containing protein